jgi:hypothetical protein
MQVLPREPTAGDFVYSLEVKRDYATASSTA